MNTVFHHLHTTATKILPGLLVALSSLFFIANITSCTTDEDIDDSGDSNLDEKTLLLNEWMSSTMKEVYYWNNRIPSSLNYKTEADPNDIVNKSIIFASNYGYKEDSKLS